MFTINSQSNKHIILETFTKKNSLQNVTSFHGELEILEIFPATFLLKTIIRTWIILKILQSALLKNEKKYLKWCKPPKNCLTQQERRKTLKKEKEKRKMWKSQTAATIFFFTFTFLCGKIYIWWKTYLEKVSVYCYISITVFWPGRLLEMQ